MARGRITGVQDLFPGPVLAALREYPSRTAIEHAGRVVTRGELLAMVRRIATGLAAAGLGPGDGIGLVLPMSPEAYAAHLAAHALGCLVAPARPGWSPQQLGHAMAGLDTLITDDGPGMAMLRAAGVLALGELLASDDPGGEVAGRGRADDVARLAFTSGSTGVPKACAHTYRAISLAYQVEQWSPVLAEVMSRFERCLIHQSLAAPAMFTYLGRCLVAGGSAVMVERRELVEGAIERHRITATVMPPAILGDLMRQGVELGSLRAVVLGGSPAGPQLLSEAAQRLGPVVWQGYGQAEAGIISMLTPDDIAAGHVTSVGRPMPGVEVRVRDGEICVRSPHMMAGYWNDPAQTQDVLKNGWLQTRDLGHLGEDGRLYLTGRARDVVMVNAEVCYAGAIETVLASHPGVSQAYVVGAPDPVTGEAIHAFVVAGPGGVPQAQALIELVRGRLSANSVPKSITVIQQVPVNASGKPDKAALIARTVSDPHA